MTSAQNMLALGRFGCSSGRSEAAGPHVGTDRLGIYDVCAQRLLERRRRWEFGLKFKEEVALGYVTKGRGLGIFRSRLRRRLWEQVLLHQQRKNDCDQKWKEQLQDAKRHFERKVFWKRTRKGRSTCMEEVDVLLKGVLYQLLRRG